MSEKTDIASLEAKLREAEAREAVMVEALSGEFIGKGFLSAVERALAAEPSDTSTGFHEWMERREALLSSPSAAASALVTRLAEAEQNERGYKLQIHAYQKLIEKEPAAARQNARTPGTVEVCERYVFHDCVNHHGHLQWKYGASKCTYGSCPRKQIPAGGYPAHQGERLSDDVSKGERPLPNNSTTSPPEIGTASSPQSGEGNNV